MTLLPLLKPLPLMWSLLWSDAYIQVVYAKVCSQEQTPKHTRVTMIELCAQKILTILSLPVNKMGRSYETETRQYYLNLLSLSHLNLDYEIMTQL
jgi:hypothetical protein